MKNKKGFTLIELLAIIVILAIIAVITVPIILNIIENSKKGAITDSVYGFKNAINTAYINKISEQPNYILPDDTYTLDQLKSELNLSIEGTEPETNTWVTIEKNKVIEACIQYGEYKIEIQNEELGTPTKQECEGPVIPTIPSCTDCVFGFIEEELIPIENSSSYTVKCPTLNGNINNFEYTNNYLKIKKNVFSGYKINESGKITNIYSCGIENGTPFCIEGGNNSSGVYGNNQQVLDDIFDNCIESDYPLGKSYICSGDNVSVTTTTGQPSAITRTSTEQCGGRNYTGDQICNYR